MRRLVRCCLISTLISANPLNQQNIKLPLEKILIAQKHALTCAKEHNVDSEILRRVLAGTVPNEEPSKKFLYCLGRSINVIAEDGHIIVDRMSKLLGDHELLEDYKASLRECNKIKKENHLETVLEMNYCIRMNSPILFVM